MARLAQDDALMTSSFRGPWSSGLLVHSTAGSERRGVVEPSPFADVQVTNIIG